MGAHKSKLTSEIISILEQQVFERSEDINTQDIDQLIGKLIKKLNKENLKLKLKKLSIKIRCLICQKSEKIDSKLDLNILECNCVYCNNCIKQKALNDTESSLLGLERVKCKHNKTIKESIIENCFGGQLRLREEQQKIQDQFLSSIASNVVEEQKSKFECTICCCVKLVEDSATLECNHRFCKDCIKQTLQFKIENRQIEEFACPQNGCGVEITPFIVEF